MTFFDTAEFYLNQPWYEIPLSATTDASAQASGAPNWKENGDNGAAGEESPKRKVSNILKFCTRNSNSCQGTFNAHVEAEAKAIYNKYYNSCGADEHHGKACFHFHKHNLHFLLEDQPRHISWAANVKCCT